MIENGWWLGAKKTVSPNFNQRPPGIVPSLIVIHNISLPPGEFGGGYVEAFFLNKLNCQLHPYFVDLDGVCVSSHCFINREGRVTQFVSFDDRAWHAGRSNFKGEEECNDFSIGIELEGTDTIPYAEPQYRVLADLTRDLMADYPAITRERITGHADIAPKRKTDPGPAFDWARYKNDIKTV